MPDIENPARAALSRLDGGRAWGQGQPYHAGRRCIIGAIVNAQEETGDDMCYTDAETDPLTPMLASIIREQFWDRVSTPYFDELYNDDVHSLYSFNDNHETTFDDVRVVLEKAAVQVDEILS